MLLFHYLMQATLAGTLNALAYVVQTADLTQVKLMSHKPSWSLTNQADLTQTKLISHKSGINCFQSTSEAIPWMSHRALTQCPDGKHGRSRSKLTC